MTSVAKSATFSSVTILRGQFFLSTHNLAADNTSLSMQRCIVGRIVSDVLQGSSGFIFRVK